MRAERNRFTLKGVAPQNDQSNSREFHTDGAENRFADLAGGAWKDLPTHIRRRFSHHLAEGDRVIYVGEVGGTHMSLLGRLIAQVAQLVGAPLPLEESGQMPVTVLVTGCESLGGQVWTRIYHRARAVPQVIQSIKRFGGVTGLEEIVGGGVGIRLTLSVHNRTLVFRSAGYFVRIAGMQLSLPDWLTPGVIEVIHREESLGRFSFWLSVTHVWAGRIIDQVAFFREDRSR